jgi:hypothetical protein
MIATICESSCAIEVSMLGAKQDRLVLKRRWRIGKAEAVIDASLNAANDNGIEDMALAA